MMSRLQSLTGSATDGISALMPLRRAGFYWMRRSPPARPQARTNFAGHDESEYKAARMTRSRSRPGLFSFTSGTRPYGAYLRLLLMRVHEIDQRSEVPLESVARLSGTVGTNVESRRDIAEVVFDLALEPQAIGLLGETMGHQGEPVGRNVRDLYGKTVLRLRSEEHTSELQ